MKKLSLNGFPSMAAITTHWRYSLQSPNQLLKEPLTISPNGLSDNEIFVSTLISAISPGTETAAFLGAPPLRLSSAPYPRLLGYMSVGLIEAVGRLVSARLQIGDLVYTHTAHQSGSIITESAVLAKLPPICSLERAAPAYLYRLALNALRRGQVSKEKGVAVIGLGAIGLATVDLCTSMKIPCHAISNHRLALSTAEKLGGAGLHRSAVEKQYLHNIERDGGLVDVCVVTTNSWEDVKLAVAMTKFNGVVSILGFPGRGLLPLEQSNFDYNLVYDRQQSLVSAGFGPKELGAGHEDISVLSNDMGKILDQITVGELRSDLLIGRIMPASDLNYALTALTRKRDFTGTILLDWQNASSAS